ncbi:hypothetical protein HQN87_08610 [Paenibacillus tritici]|uniref:Uncharacterized protein n=1 Tax=Paenibacillus tritici TaxID=1873425 RepID=A0ABX2DNH0_9BACL|nr:hypothetical protein [Paenibacillus tritici]NQX45391.1 hypothetical protein [Paenibacillus tritici]
MNKWKNSICCRSFSLLWVKGDHLSAIYTTAVVAAAVYSSASGRNPTASEFHPASGQVVPIVSSGLRSMGQTETALPSFYQDGVRFSEKY